jgi:hypothetical protein
MSKSENFKSTVNQQQKAMVGEWKVLLYDSQIEAVHIALLHTGKVLYFSGFRKQEAVTTETRLWDPKTGNIKTPNTPEDIFCAGHAFLPDGRLLSTGGTLEYRNVPNIPPWLVRFLRPAIPVILRLFGRFRARDPLLTGDTILYIFDPETEEWQFAADMPEGRWYPTNTTLPDGRILILSGRNEGGGVGSDQEVKINRRVEVYDAEQGLKQVAIIPELQMDDDDQNKKHHRFPSLYPRMHVLPLSEDEKQKYPAGRAFCSGYGPETRMLNLQTWEWEDVDKLKGGIRHDGCSVLLPLRPPDYRARILTCGGGEQEAGLEASAKNTAEMIDFGSDRPTWEMIQPMQDNRVHAGAVILPDGNILVVGGNSTGLFDDPVYNVELFDTGAEEWKTMAPITVPRGYHTTTILLPDGRVMLSGTTPFGKIELRIELYSPYYLSKGDRPAITEVPGSILYGEPFEVGYKSPQGRIKSAVLIRPGAMTHAFDMDQRYVELEISQMETSRLTVVAPPDAYIAPPGYYMLFLLNDEGVPSVAQFVHLPIKATVADFTSERLDRTMEVWLK